MKLAILMGILLLMCFPAAAKYEALSGIPAESAVYSEYRFCVDSCSSCAENCRENAYRIAAEMQGDETLCRQLPENMQEACLSRVYTAKASASMDGSYCENIASEAESNICLLNVQVEKAVDKRDENECKAAPEGLAKACLYSYYSRMAAASRDKNYCKKIEDKVASAVCSSTIAIEQAAGGADNEKESSMLTDIIINALSAVALALVFVVIAMLLRKLRSGKTAPKKRGSPVKKARK